MNVLASMYSLITSVVLTKMYKEKGEVGSKFKSEAVNLLAAVTVTPCSQRPFTFA